MIDWGSELETIVEGDFLSFLYRQGLPQVSGDAQEDGFYVGKPLEICGTAPCAIQKWVKENTPFIIIGSFYFGYEASTAYVKILWQDTNELARDFGPVTVSGRTTSAGDFAGIHEKLMSLTFRRFAEWCEKLISPEDE